MSGDVPDFIERGHPLERSIEARQIHRPRVGSQSLFAGGVVIVLEVTDRQFPDGGVHWLTRAQAGVIGFGDGSPVPVSAVHRQHMIGIAYRFEIHQQGRMAQPAQCHRGE